MLTTRASGTACPPILQRNTILIGRESLSWRREQSKRGIPSAVPSIGSFRLVHCDVTSPAASRIMAWLALWDRAELSMHDGFLSSTVAGLTPLSLLLQAGILIGESQKTVDVKRIEPEECLPNSSNEFPSVHATGYPVFN